MNYAWQLYISEDNNKLKPELTSKYCSECKLIYYSDQECLCVTHTP